MRSMVTAQCKETDVENHRQALYLPMLFQWFPLYAVDVALCCHHVSFCICFDDLRAYEPGCIERLRCWCMIASGIISAPLVLLLFLGMCFLLGLLFFVLAADAHKAVSSEERTSFTSYFCVVLLFSSPYHRAALERTVKEHLVRAPIVLPPAFLVGYVCDRHRTGAPKAGCASA